MTVTTIEETTPSAPADPGTAATDAPVTAPLVTADLLVEDVSIDGMCGVY